MHTILKLPHLKSLNAGERSKARTSLYDAILKMFEMYKLAAETKYHTVRHLRTFCTSQTFRISSFVGGRTSIATLLTDTKSLLYDTVRYAETAYDTEWEQAAEFESMHDDISANIKAVDAVIESLDGEIAKKQKALKQYITRIAADGIAIMFVSAVAALALVAGPAVAFKAVTGATGLAEKADVPISQTFRTFYAPMDIEEMAASIASLKQFQSELKTVAKELAAALKIFRHAATGGDRILTQLREMQQRITDVQEYRTSHPDKARMTLGPDNMSDIQLALAATHDACEEWTNAFFANGMEPLEIA